MTFLLDCSASMVESPTYRLRTPHGGNTTDGRLVVISERLPGILTGFSQSECLTYERSVAECVPEGQR
jgi:hypothetical protein